MEQTTTYEAAAYTAQGAARDRVTLPAELFDGTVNVPVMHQAVKAFLATEFEGGRHSRPYEKYFTAFSNTFQPSPRSRAGSRVQRGCCVGSMWRSG